MIRPCVAIWALMCLVALPARADELQLKNGDRITGTTTSLAAGTLVFRVGTADLRIRWADVVSLSVDREILVTIGRDRPVAATFAAPDPSGQVSLIPGGRPVPLDEITALTRPVPKWALTGGAAAGVVETAGNTRVNNVRLSSDFVAKSSNERYTASAFATQAEDRGAETARNWTLNGKYDLFLTTRMFATANGTVASDRFRDIDLRSAVALGLGYQAIDTPRVKLTADSGFAWVDERYRSVSDDSYTSAHESATLTIEILRARAQFFHTHDGYFGLSNDDKRFLHMQNGIRVGLVRGFVTIIEQDLDYDRHPSPGRRQTDRTFSLNLGYRF